MSLPIELRQLRYFVAVAEELHFGRAAERLHMSQSPLSRAIRELEHELDVVLFVRTTRRVELTPPGIALLERARHALKEVDGAVADARRAAAPEAEVVSLGYGPFGAAAAAAIAADLTQRGYDVRLEEEVTPDALQRIGARELTASVVMETPGAARRHGVRIDTLRDDPLLAALPETHQYASAAAIPIGAFVAECVLLPREPPGRLFNAWFRALVRAAGFELERTLETLSAPWDRRMLPVANGDNVAVLVSDWTNDAIEGVVAVPFDPPLTFPSDLASCWPPGDATDAVVEAATRARDARRWLTHRAERTELPDD